MAREKRKGQSEVNPQKRRGREKETGSTPCLGGGGRSRARCCTIRSEDRIPFGLSAKRVRKGARD